MVTGSGFFNVLCVAWVTLFSRGKAVIFLSLFSSSVSSFFSFLCGAGYNVLLGDTVIESWTALEKRKSSFVFSRILFHRIMINTYLEKQISSYVIPSVALKN